MAYRSLCPLAFYNLSSFLSLFELSVVGILNRLKLGTPKEPHLALPLDPLTDNAFFLLFLSRNPSAQSFPSLLHLLSPSLNFHALPLCPYSILCSPVHQHNHILKVTVYFSASLE